MARAWVGFLVLLHGTAFSALRECPRDEVAKRVELFLLKEAQHERFSGSVLISKSGKPLLEKGFNYADREHKVENTANTKFAIGSLTKQFTAVAILQLVESGKIRLDDPASKYIPQLSFKKPVLVRNLLSHQSGIGEYAELPQLGRVLASADPFKEMVPYLNKHGLCFVPGKRFEYSNSNYLILGKIIEKVSGVSYERYLKDNVFSKAGLKETGIFFPKAPPAQMATGYHKVRKNKIKEMGGEEFEDLSKIPYDGGLYSTVRDMHLWQAALSGGKIIPPQTFSLMTESRLKNYGFGLSLRRVSDKKALSHGGIVNGFESYAVYFPEEDAGIILLGNLEVGSFKKLADRIAKEVF